MKKTLIFALIFLIAINLIGCVNTDKIVSVKQLKDRNVGVMSSSGIETMVLDIVPKAKVTSFTNVTTAVDSLKSGEIDAFVYAEPYIKNIAKQDNEFTVLNELIFSQEYVFGVNKENTELLNQINDCIVKMKSDLVYEEAVKRWMPTDSDTQPLPAAIKLSGENGKLTFGTCASSEPMSFVKNGTVTGFEVELAKRIASYLGKSLDIIDIPYDQLGTSLAEKKVDFIASSLTKSSDLGVPIAFSEMYYSGGVGVMTKK